MNTEIERQRKRLDSLFEQVSSLSEQIELQSHWARYMCVLVSGFIENSVKIIYGEYARSRAEPRVANYVRGKLENFQNPKMAKILELTSSFSPKWKKWLEDEIQDKQKDAIDSIVENRHKIAHGKDVGISYIRIKEYYESTLPVLILIEKMCSDDNSGPADPGSSPG